MRAIPQKDKKILIDKRQQCAYCGRVGVQWHHPFMYAGKQLTEWWATAFACESCHHKATPHNNKYVEVIREFFEHELLHEHILKFVSAYPKGTWFQKLNYLNKKYGPWSKRWKLVPGHNLNKNKK